MGMEKPDLSHYNLFIATPVMDGRPESNFNDSLIKTKALLEEHGAKLHHLTHKYCADIYLARARLLSAFLREKDATHMMFIDADMGWEAQDVARMLMLQRDFLAVAGPKKKYPLEFAFQLCDEHGKPIPLYHELETNVAEVTAVGAAFLMITKDCAQKIVDAHPELEFDADENTVEYAVFDPIIINVGDNSPRRRLSEDYSFCYRWRQLGGKVELLMDVRLTHTGSHTFSGCLLEELVKHDPSFKDVA